MSDEYQMTDLETELRDYLRPRYAGLLAQVTHGSRCIAVPQRFADALIPVNDMHATFLRLPLIADDVDHAEIQAYVGGAPC